MHIQLSTCFLKYSLLSLDYLSDFHTQPFTLIRATFYIFEKLMNCTKPIDKTA